MMTTKLTESQMIKNEITESMTQRYGRDYIRKCRIYRLWAWGEDADKDGWWMETPEEKHIHIVQY